MNEWDTNTPSFNCFYFGIGYQFEVIPYPQQKYKTINKSWEKFDIWIVCHKHVPNCVKISVVGAIQNAFIDVCQ